MNTNNIAEPILDIINGLTFSDKLSIASIVSGLFFSIIVSAYFFHLGIRAKRLVYNVHSQVLYPSKMSYFKGLKLSFKGKPVQDFIISTIGIKNIGTEVIENADFAKLCPLCLKTEGLLHIQETPDCYLDKITNPYNDIQLKQVDENTILIEFDYLGVGDSFSITVMHSGFIDISCKLKAGKQIESDVPVDRYEDAIKISRRMFLLLPMIILFSVVPVYLLDFSLPLAFGVFIIGFIMIMRIAYRFFHIPTTRKYAR